ARNGLAFERIHYSSVSVLAKAKDDDVKVAWIFRDDKGNTILHSRHAFSNVGTRREDELIAIQWAVRDIINTRQQRIILDSSCALAKDTIFLLQMTSTSFCETSDRLYHSYIACGGPIWLLQRIESEARLSFRYWGLIPLGCYGLYSCEHPW
ncbi:hypothetical protein HID58_079528, partial [Brassica napus]